MMTIQENQEKIKNIYKDINQAHGHDHDFFFGYLTRTIASGFKKIHKGFDPSEKFSKSIAYLFGLCELSGIDLESSFLKFWKKKFKKMMIQSGQSRKSVLCHR